MKRSKRFENMEKSHIYRDVASEEWVEIGLMAMNSPNDPKPSICVSEGKIVEMDGKNREDFDLIDTFIADCGINGDKAAAAMKIDSQKIARMLVDINVPKEEILQICAALTPAKLVEVVNYLNVVEIMMAQMKMRARKTPANQAHVTNNVDNPVLLAADAAEAALRGFAELETTCAVTRNAPFNALGILVGGQVGRAGILTQCAMEEATELKLGIRGLTTYAETLSVYGTDAVLTDGDDTPWSKAFLAAAYASRGIKVRFSSGTGSEVMMGYAEKKSMLYLEARCIWLTKACGSQGTQNGSIDGIGLSGAVPGGFRAIACENLIASMLGLECAAGNDTWFTNSPMRKTAKFLMQMLPGADFVTSGFSSTPNVDNVFSGSGEDCDDYLDWYRIQRDMKVDGALVPIEETEAIRVRNRAAKAMQCIFSVLGYPEITEEEIEAATYAYTSKEMPPRNTVDDIKAATKMMDDNITGFDIAKVLYENEFEDVGRNIFEIMKQRLTGDYLQTSAIFDAEFNVLSALNDKNDYTGPGSGYQISGERWEILKKDSHAMNPQKVIEESMESAVRGNSKEELVIEEIGDFKQGIDPTEVVIAVSNTFGTKQNETMMGLAHSIIIKEVLAGIEEEGVKARFLKCYNSSDLAVMASTGSRLSGSGICIGIQSKGTTVIHQKDLVPLENLELFPQAPLYTAETYRAIGKNGAKYAKGEIVEPLPFLVSTESRLHTAKATILHNYDTTQVVPMKKAVEFTVSILEKEEGSC